MKRVAGIGLLGIGVAAWIAFAQEPPPALFGERVDVEVVNVDVIVTDRDGKRVTDLLRDDFELRIDGQPVAIEYFAGPAGSAERPALAPKEVAPVEIVPRTVEGSPQRLVVVFVDQTSLALKTSSRIVEEIAEFVLPKMDGSTSVLIATFVEHLRILAPMTSDRTAVEKALDELREIRGRGSILERERTAIEADIRSVMVAAPAGGPVPSANERRAQFIQSQRRRIETDILQFGERSLDRQRRSVAALREWVNALAAIEGRKSLLLGTDGYQSTPATHLQTLLEGIFRSSFASQGIRESFTSTEQLDTTGRELVVEFEEMLRAAENARVSLYTLSSRTPPVVQNNAEMGGSGIELAAPLPRDQGLVEASSSVVRLGTATGGGNLYLDEDLSRNLERVTADEGASYSLGFTTGAEAGDRVHAITVAVSRPDLAVRTRESFRRRTLPERAEQALAAATSLAATSNPLGISIELGEPRPADKKSSVVPLLVRIPLRDVAFVPEGDRLRGRLSARVAILDDRGEQRLSPSTPIAVDVAAVDEPRIATHAWAYRAEMRLSPGMNRVAVVITDEIAGVLAATTQTIDVAKKGERK